MVFKAKEENNGQVDPNINLGGRRKREKQLTRREIRGNELLSLLRKVKPHVAEAIMKAALIMKNNDASHQNQLKAAVILLDNYKSLLGDLYGTEVVSDETGEEVQPNTPLFSLTVINES